MNSHREKIFSVLLTKIALALCVFVFTGFNNSVHAIPQERETTELVISEKYANSAQIFSFDLSIEAPQFIAGFTLYQVDNDLSKSYTHFTRLVVKAQSASYFEFKESVFNIFIPLHFSSYPSDNPSQIVTAG